jgi:hypothetical protein
MVEKFGLTGRSALPNLGRAVLLRRHWSAAIFPEAVQMPAEI